MKTTTEPAYDFRTSGPPLRVCHFCFARFRDWEVSDRRFELLPPAVRDLELCEDDFRDQLALAGHDPKKVRITRETWKRRLEAWEQSKDAPAHHAHTRFTFPRGRGKVPYVETMWCEVLDFNDPDCIRVRLLNTTVFDESLRRGTLVTASWDGLTVHGLTGRPVLQFVEVVQRKRIRKRKNCN